MWRQTADETRFDAARLSEFFTLPRPAGFQPAGQMKKIPIKSMKNVIFSACGTGSALFGASGSRINRSVLAKAHLLLCGRNQS
jgi:hypothetical protein